MERIGIAASKMAKGNLFLYNVFVVLLSVLFSVLIFFIAGSSIVLGLIIISFLVNGIMPLEFEKAGANILHICLVTLTTLVVIFNLFAISRNIRFSKIKK
ncbi:MAG: hypothetical protein WC552_00740 [Candidatus Omnitrophota bacterium]